MSVKNPPVLLLRADASPAIGIGHAMRCFALAKAWQSTHGSVWWLMAESVQSFEEHLGRHSMKCTRTLSAPGSIADADDTISEAQRTNAAWVIVGGYRFAPGYIQALKRARLQVLTLDDDGRFDSYAADAVLNQNVSATPAMYANRAPYTRLLLGTSYVLLRPEFMATPRRALQSDLRRKILITMGGSDPENVTEKAVRALGRTDVDAEVVIGGGNPRLDALTELAARVSSRIRIEQNPQNMAMVMGRADIAISAAGSTCWELAHMGIPAIVIALSSDQLGIAQGAEEKGIAVNLGWHANLSEEAIRESLLSLLNDHHRRREMTERGRRLIDGMGASRVVEFLQKSL